MCTWVRRRRRVETSKPTTGSSGVHSRSPLKCSQPSSAWRTGPAQPLQTRTRAQAEAQLGTLDMARDIATDKKCAHPQGYVARRERGRAERMRARRGLDRGPNHARRATGP
eukprot:1762370-Prymnesium_polylepis.1